jgi:hypothetical protein
MGTQHDRQPPSQGRQDCPVSPVRTRPADLTAQDRDLMTEDNDFCIFGCLAAS